MNGAPLVKVYSSSLLTITQPEVPVQLYSKQHWFDTSHFGSFEEFDIRGAVTGITLMESSKKVAGIGQPNFSMNEPQFRTHFVN